MRSFFACAAILFASVAVAGEQSVLVPATPTPAPAPVTAPTVVVVGDSGCANGSCRVATYQSESYARQSCRPRLFGGYVTRNHERTVHRPVRCVGGRCSN